MSDESIVSEEENTKQRDPKEEAFRNALHQRKVIAESLKNGTLSCLPTTDGYADTQPAVNLVNGTYYHGANLLYLKEHQKQNGYPTAEYVSSSQIDKANENNPALYIRKGEKGISIYVSNKNEETGEYEEKNIRLFNVAQTSKPWEMKEWANQKQQEKLQEKLDYLRTQYGSNYQLPESKQKAPGPDIKCTSSEPAQYLGQYFAAVSMGSRFQATAEQAAQFSQKMEEAMFKKIGVSQKTGEPVSNPFELSKISNEASRYCKNFIKDIRMEVQKAEQPQQKHEQQQSKSRNF